MPAVQHEQTACSTAPARPRTAALRAAAVGGAVVLAVVLAACGGGNGDAKATATTPAAVVTTTALPADPDAADKAAVLAAYAGMTGAAERTFATGKLDAKVETYAADKALAGIKVTMVYYQDHGTVTKGVVTHSPKVTAINTASDPLKAVVTDCADSTHYDDVDAKTGKVVPYSGPRRHVVTSTAMRSRTGAWKFYTSVIERDRTC